MSSFNRAEAVRRFEKLHIERILLRFPDKKEAARRLGVGLSSLYRRIAELGIQTGTAARQAESNESNEIDN